MRERRTYAVTESSQTTSRRISRLPRLFPEYLARPSRRRPLHRLTPSDAFRDDPGVVPAHAAGHSGSDAGGFRSGGQNESLDPADPSILEKRADPRERLGPDVG